MSHADQLPVYAHVECTPNISRIQYLYDVKSPLLGLLYIDRTLTEFAEAAPQLSFSHSPNILRATSPEDALYTLMKYLAIANEDAARVMVTVVFNVVHEMQEFRSYYSSGFYYPWTQYGEQRQLVDGLLFNVVVYGPRCDFHHI